MYSVKAVHVVSTKQGKTHTSAQREDGDAYEVADAGTGLVRAWGCCILRVCRAFCWNFRMRVFCMFCSLYYSSRCLMLSIVYVYFLIIFLPFVYCIPSPAPYVRPQAPQQVLCGWPVYFQRVFLRLEHFLLLSMSSGRWVQI